MAKESSNNEPKEESDQEDLGSERTLHKGCSRFSRKIDLSEWLSRKEKVKPERIKPTFTKRTRLNTVSKKGKKKQQEYAKAKAEHYRDTKNQRCAICGKAENLSIHHAAKRAEGNHANKETFITLCLLGDFLNKKFPELNQVGSGCHGFVEANKSWARENNYLE